MRPDFWDVSVSELQVIADPVVTLVAPDTDRLDEIVSNKSEHTDSRISEFSVFPLELRIIADPVVTLVPPDTDRLDEIVSNKVEHTDSRIGEFSVFPLGFRDPSIGMSTLDGVSWFTAQVTLGYRAMTRSGLVTSCDSPARGMWGTFSLQAGWTGGAWIIGKESSGPRNSG